jgi:hypothetical protein
MLVAQGHIKEASIMTVFLIFLILLQPSAGGPSFDLRFATFLADGDTGAAMLE